MRPIGTTKLIRVANAARGNGTMPVGSPLEEYLAQTVEE